MKATLHSFSSQPLSGGLMGDIPLHVTHLAAGLAWWSLWALVCVLAVSAAPARANQGTAPTLMPTQAAPPVAGDLQQNLGNQIDALVRSETGEMAEINPQAPARAASRPRFEVVLGQLDPRLKLAPCDKVRADLPEGSFLSLGQVVKLHKTNPELFAWCR